jgi:hypothetical protein
MLYASYNIHYRAKQENDSCLFKHFQNHGEQVNETFMVHKGMYLIYCTKDLHGTVLHLRNYTGETSKKKYCDVQKKRTTFSEVP